MKTKVVLKNVLDMHEKMRSINRFRHSRRTDKKIRPKIIHILPSFESLTASHGHPTFMAPQLWALSETVQ